MPDKLCILACQHLAPELARIVAPLPDVTWASFASKCGRPPVTWQDLAQAAACTGSQDVYVLGSCCLAMLDEPPQPPPSFKLWQAELCFELVVSQELAHHWIQEGAYLVTPGWLANWQEWLEGEGFDREIARSFFAESCHHLLLLDTLVDDRARQRMETFAAFVDRPFQVLPVGIDYVSQRIMSLVQAWRLEERDRRAKAAINEAHQQLAEYATGLDLLGLLTRAQDESTAIVRVLDLFAMLFAPQKLCLLPFYEGSPGEIRCASMASTSSDGEQEPAALEAALIDFYRRHIPYEWTEGDKGFLLRVGGQEDPLGVVLVDEITFPVFRERYLNLALAIADVCALAIRNARAYQQIQQAERSLRENEERLRRIFEFAPIGIDLYDLQGRLVMSNQRSQDLLTGYRSDTLFSDPRLDGDAVQRLRSGEPIYTQVSLGVGAPETMGGNPARFPAEVCLDLIYTPLGADREHISGYLALIQDVTERKHAEQSLIRASRLEATATLAGGIAHDFNNLMVGVLGYAELLQEELADQPDAIDMLTRISASAQRAGKLAQQMLAFARGGKYFPTLLNLNRTILDVMQHQEQLVPSGIQIRYTVEPSLWDVKADMAQMSEVFLNLLTNAIEAIEGEGEIAITTSNRVLDAEFALAHGGLQAGPYVYLAVQDTGCGMSPEVQARIFEPFFTTKFQGRGLGLAAVFGIIQNHDGQISVYSEEGLGTVFKVYLPAVLAEFEALPPIESLLSTRKTMVLLIDDDDSVLTVTRLLLARLGYQTLIAHNGMEAIEIARTFEGDIDVALLDMAMPVMNGVETYPRLVAIRPQIKVLICSGYEPDAATQSLLKQGACCFLQKPFQAHALGAAICQALGGEG
jgi:PAS domain S-box-containing protein